MEGQGFPRLQPLKGDPGAVLAFSRARAAGATAQMVGHGSAPRSGPVRDVESHGAIIRQRRHRGLPIDRARQRVWQASTPRPTSTLALPGYVGRQLRGGKPEDADYHILDKPVPNARPR
jgi:hypothetical protein